MENDAGKGTAATSAAAPRATAANPATPMIQLSPQNAKRGMWEIEIAVPRLETYSYDWQGVSRTTEVFRCDLVSTSAPTFYCLGEVKKTKEQKKAHVDALEKFKAGLKFRLSKAVLNAESKAEYNSTTHKVTVNLLASHLDPLLQGPVAFKPEPTTTCADCVKIRKFQHFDITALIKRVSEPRNSKNGQLVRDFFLLDGSVEHPAEAHGSVESSAAPGGVEPPAEKLVQPKVAVFYKPDRKEDPPYIKDAVENAGKPVPYHFFGLQAQFKESAKSKRTAVPTDGHEISTAITWHAIMKADGAKAEQLKAIGAELLESTQQVLTLEKPWAPNVDHVTEELGHDTFAAHLAQLANVTGIPALDADTTVWQGNWLFPSVPGDVLTTDDGARLFPAILFQDVSGAFTARVAEKAALTLSNLPDKETFLQAISDGDPVFPTIVSTKVVRKLVTEGKDTAETTDNAQPLVVYLNVVDAAPQTFENGRTAAALTLIPLLRSFSGLTSAILPATLSMTKSSSIYPLMVQYPCEGMSAQPCSKVWLVIKATKKSQCTEEPPYTVTTEGVEDGTELDTDEASNAPPVTKTLVTMCGQNNRSAFLINPVRGKPLHALVVVTAMKGDTIYADSIEIIQTEVDRKELVASMQKEISLAIDLLHRASSDSKATWSDATSPLASGRCKRLGRSPTDVDLESFTTPNAKKPKSG